MKKFSGLLCVVLALMAVKADAQSKMKKPGYYEVVLYQYSDSAQANQLHLYLSKAYLPALHRQQISQVGVFEALSNDTAAVKQLYVIFPLQSFEQAATLSTKLNMDQQYLTNGNAYLNAPYNKPAYNRMEQMILEQFRLAPFFTMPKLKSSYKDKIYELRSYESASEKIFANKVEMFNEGGEIEIFKSLNFNAVFYSSVIVGSHMPNLMYMTSFENMADRDEHWKQFGNAPAWKTLSSMPKYQNNVSKITITFLKAKEYSDF